MKTTRIANLMQNIAKNVIAKYRMTTRVVYVKHVIPKQKNYEKLLRWKETGDTVMPNRISHQKL